MDSFPPRYRSTPIAVILAVFLFNTPGSTADAPVVTQERVVALTESVGYQIDPLERERYGLFPQRMGFLLAEFLLRGETYWLRLSFRSGSERIVEQSQLTDAQFLAWRQSVLAIDQGRTAAPLAVLSDTDRRDGRLRMVTDVFLYGLWLYGPATISVRRRQRPRTHCHRTARRRRGLCRRPVEDTGLPPGICTHNTGALGQLRGDVLRFRDSGAVARRQLSGLCPVSDGSNPCGRIPGVPTE